VGNKTIKVNTNEIIAGPRCPISGFDLYSYWESMGFVLFLAEE
jgi:hypothetical protein